MTRSQLAAKQAAQSVALTIGFYILALAVIAVLLIPLISSVVNSHSKGSARLIGFCTITAGVIAWSIWPRFGRSVPDALRIYEREHPLLFEEIKRAASRLRQPMPHEVYVDLQMNAGVTEQGGFFGWRSTRMMLIGLPLLRHLTVSDFRTVLAHEFGHYVGGETKYSGWVCRTRQTMERTVENLQSGFLISAPFRWYAAAFMRISQAVAREQEFQADRLAATVYGVQPTIDALRKIPLVAAAFEWYWESEVVTVLSQNARPPILDGFSRFLVAPLVHQKLEEIANSPTLGERPDIYDSHPTTKERIAALSHLPVAVQSATDARPAIELLARGSELEGPIIDAIQKIHAGRRLAPTTWENAVGRAYVPMWRALVDDWRDLFGHRTIQQLPEIVALREQMIRRIEQRFGDGAEAGDAAAAFRSLVWSGLAVALIDDGWECLKLPGMEPEFRKDGRLVSFADTMRKMDQRELSTAEWTDFCLANGIGSLALGGKKNQLSRASGASRA